MRRLLVGGAATALVMAGVAGPAAADTDEIELTLLGTTDTHGHIFNWDYFENAPYTDDEDVLGFTRVATRSEERRVGKECRHREVPDLRVIGMSIDVVEEAQRVHRI